MTTKLTENNLWSVQQCKNSRLMVIQKQA